jgi:hypothetical protein
MNSVLWGSRFDMSPWNGSRNKEEVIAQAERVDLDNPFHERELKARCCGQSMVNVHRYHNNAQIYELEYHQSMVRDVLAFFLSQHLCVPHPFHKQY